MAWIESHQELVHHPKLFKLISITGWRPNEAIGLLHRLWWWTLAYAESGYLGDHEPEPVSRAIDALETDYYKHKNLFKVLIEAEFVTKNIFVWDWLDYAGRYLKTKYRTSNPTKLANIMDNFDKKKKINKSVKSQTKVSTKSDTLTYLPTYLNKPDSKSFDCALDEILIKCKNNISALILSDKFIASYVEWTVYKKKIKSPVTENSIHKQLDSLANYDIDTAIAMIDKSIENGWKGLFEINTKEKNKGAGIVATASKEYI